MLDLLCNKPDNLKKICKLIELLSQDTILKKLKCFVKLIAVIDKNQKNS